MVEERNLKVLLCCWIDHLAQDHLGDHRELESELLGLRMLGFMEMHVNTRLGCKLLHISILMQVDLCPTYVVVV